MLTVLTRVSLTIACLSARVFVIGYWNGAYRNKAFNKVRLGLMCLAYNSKRGVAIERSYQGILSGKHHLRDGVMQNMA